MAKKVLVELVDDIDGKQADETLRFGIDGTEYEIDLSEKHATKLRSALASFITHGRRVGRLPSTRSSARHPVPGQRGPARVDKEQNKAIRAWAKRKGKPISDRGRIPQEIVDEYNADAGR